MKSKLKYTSHVPDWGFVSSPVSVNLLVQTLVWTCELWSLTDFTTSIHTHTISRKSQTKRLLLADVEFLGYTLRNCFFFFFPRKELNVIQQLKDDKFTDWILKIRKRICMQLRYAHIVILRNRKQILKIRRNTNFIV